jgi:hypothetical protein
MAYGPEQPDVETPPALSEDNVAECLADLGFGIPADRADVAHGSRTRSRALPPSEITHEMNSSESTAIHARRTARGRTDVEAHKESHNGVGLALSGASCPCLQSR